MSKVILVRVFADSAQILYSDGCKIAELERIIAHLTEVISHKKGMEPVKTHT